MKERIYLSPPHMSGNELTYINKAFEENWISSVGPNLDRFEQQLNEHSGKYCAALSSGTAAIHLALIHIGVSRGDSVICSSFTFTASANPIVYLGAKPIFVDSEPSTWNMSPQYLEEAIVSEIRNGKKPKAIILVHLYGMPAQIDSIVEIAKRYEIHIVEDAAEALGSTYCSKNLGTFGDLGIYSFNGNKMITTSGGGALVAEDPETIEKVKFLSTQARDKAPHYQHSQLGYNYRMSNISAGIGVGQMEVLDKRVEQRRNVFNTYKLQLSNDLPILFLEEPEGCFSNRWLTTIWFDHKSIDIYKIMSKLENENIETRALWKPLHMQPLFDGNTYYGDQLSESLFKKGLCLPSGSNLQEEDLHRIISNMRKFL